MGPPPDKSNVAGEEVFGINKTRIWPSNVPSEAVASKVLARQAVCVDAEEPTGAFFAGLGPLEEAVARGTPVAFDAAALRKALVMEWRQTVALHLQQWVTGQIDKAALDALLNETDAALGALTTPLTADEETKKAFSRVRGALARDVSALAMAEAKALAADGPPKAIEPKKGATRLVKFADDVRREPMKKLPIVFAIVAAIGAAAHTAFWLMGHTDHVDLPDTPASMTSGAGIANDLKVYRLKDPDAPNPDDIAELRKRAAAEGKVVLEQGGRFIVMPAPAGVPEAAKAAEPAPTSPAPAPATPAPTVAPAPGTTP